MKALQSSRVALAYHQLKGMLGLGDLHPGGERATDRLLSWIEAERPTRVLEIGAGIGNTSRRMARRGWEVVALEPDPVLFETLEKQRTIRAERVPFLNFTDEGSFDAIVAESVLFMNDLESVFRHAHSLLKVGGVLAFVEGIWSESVSDRDAESFFEQTKAAFGIPVGSRRALSIQDWLDRLEASGFQTVHRERIDGSARPTRLERFAAILRASRDPRALLEVLEYRRRKGRISIPSGALESWVYLGRRA